MKRYKLSLSSNPSFNTVTGLTNTTFNPTTYVENRMATEEQISELYNRIVEQEQRRDRCCRDIIVWETHTQIVRLNSNSKATYNGTNYDFNSAGVVVSDFDENVNTGTMRRGMKFTVTFPIKWDNNLYYPCTPTRVSDNTSCDIKTYLRNLECANKLGLIVQYRYIQDGQNTNPYFVSCTSNNNNRANFMDSPGSNTVPSPNQSFGTGMIINPGNNWGSFIYDMKSDGTVTLTDNRKNTNYNIIRFYTQWTLNQCANGTLLSDNV